MRSVPTFTNATNANQVNNAVGLPGSDSRAKHAAVFFTTVAPYASWPIPRAALRSPLRVLKTDLLLGAAALPSPVLPALRCKQTELGLRSVALSRSEFTD